MVKRTTQVFKIQESVKNTAFFIMAHDSLLYIVKIITKEIGIFNPYTKVLLKNINTDTIQGFNNIKMIRAFRPIVYNNLLYVLFNEDGFSLHLNKVYVAGFDLCSLELRFFKKLDTVEGKIDTVH
ncbi:MAG: hypothetical protein JW795_15070 [Chitinivibrionales bacterium]|nr:hypothetical protein [Chitinivibrionales bacterium]